MAKQKQHVFSARTTEEGLRLLNGLRRERGIGWDELVIDGMCAHYGLDRAALSLPKKEKPAKEAGQATEERPAEAGQGQHQGKQMTVERGQGGECDGWRAEAQGTETKRPVFSDGPIDSIW
jgi:hypothetical protein